MSGLLPSSGGSLAALVATRRVLVLCGAGGVGKTTTSAALGVAAARAGRRVLVLTIDPARRLAEAMGIPAHAAEPTAVGPEALARAALPPEASLHAWMLDPRVVFERLVRRLAAPEKARAILASPVYARLTEVVAGMKEYTAGEALHAFVEDGRYDLVVLDTPPSRHALDFLDAPGRLGRLLDDGVLQLLAGREGGLLQRAGRFVGGVMDRVFGEGFLGELRTFVGAFGGLFGAMRLHAQGLQRLLASSDAAFVLVTSPAQEALDEARYFRGELARRGLPFAGYVLNRSDADLDGAPSLGASLQGGAGVTPVLLAKVERLAEAEHVRARADAALLEALRRDAGEGFAVAAPHLGEGVEELAGLGRLAARLVPPAPSR
jgi:anion-transporting  ArsA/GET3 family ATPase